MFAPTATSWSSLLDVHRELEELFALHQEELLCLGLERAAELLGAYRALLALHMRHEENVLLPLFARAGTVERWPAVLYTGQHEKMRGMLERAAEGLDAMRAEPGGNLRRRVIALLDHEATYKHLAEHHDGAEREGLFPTLDRVTTEDERASLLAGLRREWAHARQEQQASLGAALTPSGRRPGAGGG